MPLKGETKQDRLRRVGWINDVANEGGSDCREWPWARDRKGYGRIHWNGRPRYVGHVMLEVTGKTRPSLEHHQLHACDNPPCCAPWHLRWGTNAENRAEAIARGRHFTKLTPEQVQSIYYGSGRQRDIAANYGVTQRVVWQIKSGETWSRVTGHPTTQEPT